MPELPEVETVGAGSFPMWWGFASPPLNFGERTSASRSLMGSPRTSLDVE